MRAALPSAPCKQLIPTTSLPSPIQILEGFLPLLTDIIHQVQVYTV